MGSGIKSGVPDYLGIHIRLTRRRVIIQGCVVGGSRRGIIICVRRVFVFALGAVGVFELEDM